MLIKSHDAASSIHIDFVPMVDTLFNLLIFFLLATTIKQAEREMSVALPLASAGAPISVQLREFIVNVQADGQIVVAGKVIDPESLGGMVKDAIAANPQQKVTVRGDRTTAYANVARVLDICKISGVQEPYLDTVLRE